MAARMTTTTAVAAAAVFGLAVQAMQPGAVPPVKAPMRSLEWGEINFLHTTDTHGWHGGHMQESQYSADWGDYVSFASHMRAKADQAGVDLLLVDTGDRVEGNGLYDASDPKGRYTYDIFREQDIDIICTGNHELYQADTADRERQQTVPNFAGRYLASNLDYLDPETGKQSPMAPQRYRTFTTKHQNRRVVAFGFLFDFTGNANNTVVTPVGQAVRQDWFKEAVQTEDVDLFVVIGHIGARMRELETIYQAIRSVQPTTPIALFAGHAHVRDTVQFDERAVAVASGRYLETIGWMSVNVTESETSSEMKKMKTKKTKTKKSKKSKKTKKTKTKKTKTKSPIKDSTSSPIFSRRYIDNNLLGFYRHSNTDAVSFPTEHGRNVTAAITEARTALGLDARFGCAPQTYYLQRRPVAHPDSVFTLLRERVLPEAIVRRDRADVPRIVMLNTGAMRFDIFRGPFTRDTTYILSPFVSRMRFLADVPYAQAKQVQGILNQFDKIVAAGEGNEALAGLDFRQLNVPESYGRPGHSLSEATLDSTLGENDFQHPLGSDASPDVDSDALDASLPPLIPGYTTIDDLGSDGDDAIHAPLPFHALPNVIQSEVAFEGTTPPQTVDFVFFDFIEPFVLAALEFAEQDVAVDARQHYTRDDVQTYLGGTFTDHLARWIKHNWNDRC